MRELSDKIIVATNSLTKFLMNALKSKIEIRRISLCYISLDIGGVSMRNSLNEQLCGYILDNQQADGGWIDVEETLLAVKSLSMLNKDYQTQVDKGKEWLLSQRHPDAGWGKTNRDISRIPVTGLLLHLLPELSGQEAVSWLKNEWKKDFNGDTRLTYKGAFFLLGLRASGVLSNDCPLIGETYSFLENEQNEDGGFGPWKDHPIGSDPWSTGIVLLGLLAYPELTKKKVIENTISWLARKQLPNGLWPYHYIDEGSAYAYWGFVEALKYLKREDSQ